MTRGAVTGDVLMLPATTRIGVDLLPIDGVDRALAEFGDRYLRRVYTDAEVADCMDAQGRPDAVRLAGRFAVKEATLKALDGPATVRFTHIATTSDASGRPRLALTGTARLVAASLGVRSAAVSISHDGPYAVAVVLIDMGAGV